MSDQRNASLAEVDPVMRKPFDNEVARQANGLELIASENFCQRSCARSCRLSLYQQVRRRLSRKRYYGGCEYADVVEQTAIESRQGIVRRRACERATP